MTDSIHMHILSEVKLKFLSEEKGTNKKFLILNFGKLTLYF